MDVMDIPQNLFHHGGGVWQRIPVAKIRQSPVFEYSINLSLSFRLDVGIQGHSQNEYDDRSTSRISAGYSSD